MINTSTKGRPLRVCFVSAHLFYHSIGKMMVQLLAFLQRTNWDSSAGLGDEYNADVHAIFMDKTLKSAGQVPGEGGQEGGGRSSSTSGGRVDQVTQALDQHLGPRFKRVKDSMKELSELLERGQFDWIIYLDLGMEFTTYLTSAARLAPYQAVWWGHPITSGLPNVDYFFGLNVESINAQNYYTEQHIRMFEMNSAPLSPLVNEDRETYAKYDLYNSKIDESNGYVYEPKDIHVKEPYLMIIGRLFKIHPIMDIVLKRILQASPHGRIILVAELSDSTNSETWSRMVKSIADPDIYNRIWFIDYSHYSEVLLGARGVLDTFPYGGCLTTHDSLSNGVPLVTLPPEHVRGRYSLGMYNQINHMDLVAHNTSHYVSIASRLLNDISYWRKQTTDLRYKWKDMNHNKKVATEWLQFMRKVSD